MTAYLVTLDDPQCTDPERVGAKAAALARLTRAGFEVPDAVVLTTDAHRAAGSGTGRLPEAIERALITVAARYGDATLAVRSSSVVEDAADRSFAGQFETVLGVRGAERLVAAVQTVWRSATGARAVSYQAGQGDGPAPMAVLIQRQVDAAAGVAFTADPVTGDRSTTVVEAVRGLGDRTVSGEETPQRWTVTADGGARNDCDGEGVLSNAVAGRVAELARAVAAAFGAPQDIEWAYDGGRVWLLQARPITALGPPPVEPVPVPIEVPEGYWEREASHAPRPFSPFFRSFWMTARNRPMRTVQGELGSLIETVEWREVGGWEYLRVVPVGGKDRPAPPAWLLWLATRALPSMRRLSRRCARRLELCRSGALVDRWYGEWRPAMAKEIRRRRDVDLTALSDAELERHLRDTIAFLEYGVEVHWRLHDPLGVALYDLAVACRELLGWSDDQACALVSGLSTTSTEPARALAKLSTQVAGNADLRSVVEGLQPDALDRARAIDPAFADDFEEYRRTYGCRALRYEVADPTLGEWPDVLLGLIRDQLTRGFDPSTVQNEADRARVTVEAEALRALDRLTTEDRERFRRLSEDARRVHPIREDNEFFTVSAPLALVRLAALEIGRRLADRGQVDARDDVFFLEFPEACAALADGRDRRALVHRRKGERAWVEAHPGPSSYGPPPPPPPPLGALPEPLRFDLEMSLWSLDRILEPEGSMQRQDSDQGRLNGVAASPGHYTGVVRVIRGEEEFGKIRAGDVVVCPITSPVWSVVFPSMGALVTDSGGILSHPAIIAREYGIPAVVATGNATELLRDGQRVTVDGTSGVVQLI